MSNDYALAKERFRVANTGDIVPVYDLNRQEVLRAANDITAERLQQPFALDVISEIAYILKAVADKPISSTDSSCAFCQAYGDMPHGQMDYDSEHECVVITAKRLLVSSAESAPSLTDAILP